MTRPEAIPPDATPWSSMPGWFLCYESPGYYLSDGLMRTHAFVTPGAAAAAALDPVGLLSLADYAALCGRRLGEYRVPAGEPVVKCKSCQASIIWTRTAGRRPIPLSVATIQRHEGAAWALAHFTDCPDARAWSRPRAPRSKNPKHDAEPKPSKPSKPTRIT